MNVLGHGERGVVASLFHEVAARADANSLLEQLQGRAKFPFVDVRPIRVFRAEILLDVNFGKLGQSDAVLLIDTGRHRVSVFVQVKVPSGGKGGWTMADEFEKFRAGPGAVGYVTNLFSELYAKVRMVAALRGGGVAELQQGLAFPPSASGKTVRKVGTHPVTERAVERLAEHLHEAYFVAVVPEEAEQAVAFCDETLADARPEGFEGWSVKHFGILGWRDVEAFCKANRLDRTRNALFFNRGQLY